MKAANDNRLLPYLLKERWWAVAMARKPDTYGPPGSKLHITETKTNKTNKQTNFT